MFDGNADHDIDLRRSALPLSVGHHAITRSSVSSTHSPSPRPTMLSRGRAASAELKKESLPASLKEIDELKLTIRKLETKVNTLESRVQYVNPWAVQHMWDVLLKLQERVGIDEPSNGLAAASGASSSGGGVRGSNSHSPSSNNRDAFDASSPEATDVFRACSPLTPSGPLSATFEVSSLFPSVAPMRSAGGALGTRPPGHLNLRWLEFEECLGRQQMYLEQSMSCNRLMSTYLPSAVAALSVRRGDDVWDSSAPRGMHSPQRWQQYSGRSADPFHLNDGVDDEQHRLHPSSSTRSRQQQEPLPRLRSKFVEALITDKLFDERLKYLLADFVHPLLEASQKRFVSEAERWMHTHTHNLEHEFHDHMKSMTEERNAVTAMIQERVDATQQTVQELVSEARHSMTDHVTTVNRLRDDVMESSQAVGLKIQRLDMFQTELMRSVNEALDIRLGALRAALERIGEQQDLLHRRMDDIQTRELMLKDMDGDGAADDGGGGFTNHRSAAVPCGHLLQQAMAYLDGMQLAPSSEAAAADDDGHLDSRLGDSVLLHELHVVLHRIWQHVTTRGVATGLRHNPKPTGAVGGRGSSTGSAAAAGGCGPIALGFSDLVLRPTSIFPIHLIVRVVSPLLLRHSRPSLMSECTRMKVPQQVARGLEAGWEWLSSLAMGVVLRRSLQGEEELMGTMEEDDAPLPLSIQRMDHGQRSSRHASRSPSVDVDSQGQPATLEMLATMGAHRPRHAAAADATTHHPQGAVGPAQSGTSFYTTTSRSSRLGGTARDGAVQHHSARKALLVAGDTDFSHLYVRSSSSTHHHRHQKQSRNPSGLVASSSRMRPPPPEGASGGSSRSSSRAPSPGVHRQLAFR